PVDIKQIEGNHHDLFGSALEFVLQHGKVRGAVLCRNDYLAIDDRRPGIYVPGIGRDLSETVRPIIAASGEHFDGGVPEMDLDAIAVELDLMEPTLAGGHLVNRCRQRRFDEAGIVGLDTTGWRLRSGIRHTDQTKRIGNGSW